MPNLTTTLRVIDSYGIRHASWDAVCKTAGSDELDTEITLLQILDNNGIEDAVWALRCWPDELSLYHFRADAADLVSHLYRDKYPSDTSVDDCIAMTHKYADGDATHKELEASAARSARAARVAWVARSARSARVAADAAETDAVVWDVVWDVVWATCAGASAALAAAMERADTYEKIEKLLRGYIEREY